MKLIIQIPAHDNESSLGMMLDELPRAFPGVDEVEWLLIDDASTDATRRVAQARGVDHIVRLPHRLGLGGAFMAGIEACLDLGADLIVTTDPRRHYEALDVPRIIAPILKGEADIVIANRSFEGDAFRGRFEKFVSKSWNRLMNVLGTLPSVDFGSGFLAISRDAACHLRVTGFHSFGIESVMQAGYKGLVIDSIDVVSRFHTPFSTITKAPFTILATAFHYRPVPFFMIPALATLVVAVFSPAWLLAAIFLSAMGAVAHLTALNRRHLESISVKLDRLGDMVADQQATWGSENPPADYLGKVDASTEIH